MWTALFCVSYLSYLLQQWNLNYNIAFLYLSIDSKLRFLSVGLKLDSIGSQFFPVHEKDEKLVFLNISQCCASKISPVC